jgi:hypothetical protein
VTQTKKKNHVEEGGAHYTVLSHNCFFKKKYFYEGGAVLTQKLKKKCMFEDTVTQIQRIFFLLPSIFFTLEHRFKKKIQKTFFFPQNVLIEEGSTHMTQDCHTQILFYKRQHTSQYFDKKKSFSKVNAHYREHLFFFRIFFSGCVPASTTTTAGPNVYRTVTVYLRYAQVCHVP